ncbi:MAG TPA: hypothetical protein ENH82_04810 [bacterium]|nr:hypothetical protein [bacterium]
MKWHNVYRRWAGSVYKVAPDVWRWWANRGNNKESGVNIHMKLSHITEARYASPVKRAFEAFERYEQFVNEFEDPDAHIGITDDITIIERDYAETEGANFASMYLWVQNVDGEEEVVFKVKEFADRFNLPYTNITPSRRGDRFYAATMYFKEGLK